MIAHNLQYKGYWINMIDYIYSVRYDDPALKFMSIDDAKNRVDYLISITEN